MPYISPSENQDKILDLVKLEAEVSKRDARIAALEAQNKKLVEALEGMCLTVEGGDYPENSIGGVYLREARALLSEVTK